MINKKTFTYIKILLTISILAFSFFVPVELKINKNTQYLNSASQKQTYSISVIKAQAETPEERRAREDAEAEAAAKETEKRMAELEKDMGPIQKGFYSVIKWLIGVLSVIPMTIISYLLWLSGILLNYSINIGIMDMGSWIKSAQSIRDGWSIFRDIISLFFIFGILYVAITTIISGWTESSRKSLANIIIAAILINFSFFFTTLLIDASNILTLSFYKKMTDCQTVPFTTSFGTASELAALETTGISNCFMKGLKIQNFYSSTGSTFTEGFSIVNTLRKENTNPIEFFVKMVSYALFMLFIAVVFLWMALNIFIRLINLIFLLITSPVMFLGMILPKFKEHSDKWVKKLTDNLVFLPVMFIFLYISYSVLIKLDGNTTVPITMDTFGHLINGRPQAIGNLVNLILILGFLAGSIVMGKAAGAAGAGLASSLVLGGFGVGMKAILGGGLGGAFRAIGKASDGKEGGLAKLGRGIGIAGRGLGNFSYDIRNTKAGAGFGSATGVDLGKANGKGYSQYKKGFDDWRTKRQGIYDEQFKKTAENRDSAARGRAKTNAESDPVYAAAKVEIAQNAATLAVEKEQLKLLQQQLSVARENNDDVQIKSITDKIIASNQKTQLAESAMKKASKTQDEVFKKELTKELKKVLGGKMASGATVDKKVKEMTKDDGQKSIDAIIKGMKADEAKNAGK